MSQHKIGSTQNKSKQKPASTTTNQNAGFNHQDIDIVQDAIEDTSQLDARSVELLNRLHGNQFVARMIQRSPDSDTIQRSGGGKGDGTKLWTVEEFQSRIEEYWMANSFMQSMGFRDDDLYDLEIKLAVYHDNVDSPFIQQSLCKEMLDLTRSWMKKNGDDKDSTNYKLMKRFGALAKKRYEELREPVEQDYSLVIDQIDHWMSDEQLQTEYKIIEEEHEGTPSSMFAVAAPLIDVAVPTIGKGKVDIKFTWPVSAQPEVKIGGHFVMEVERSPDQDVKLVSEFSIVGNLSVGISSVLKASFEAEFGGFFEAQGDTSEEALNLVSYALYKRLSSSDFSTVRDIATYFWSGGLSGSIGEELADEWAGGIEEASFGSGDDDQNGNGSGGNNYVMTGVFGGASGGVESEATGTGGKLAYKGKTGTRIDDQHRKGIGQTIHEVSVEGTFGDNVAGKLAYQWMYDDEHANMVGDKLAFEGAAVIPLEKLGEQSQWLAGSFIIPAYTSIFERGIDMAKSKTAAGVAGGTGELMVDMTAKAAFTAAAAGAEFPRLVPDSVEVGGDDGLKGNMKVKLTIEGENPFTAGGDRKVSIAITSEGELDSNKVISPVLQIKLEKSKLLFKAVYDNGSFAIEYPG